MGEGEDRVLRKNRAHLLPIGPSSRQHFATIENLQGNTLTTMFVVCFELGSVFWLFWEATFSRRIWEVKTFIVRPFMQKTDGSSQEHTFRSTLQAPFKKLGIQTSSPKNLVVWTANSPRFFRVCLLQITNVWSKCSKIQCCAKTEVLGFPEKWIWAEKAAGKMPACQKARFFLQFFREAVVWRLYSRRHPVLENGVFLSVYL